MLDIKVSNILWTFLFVFCFFYFPFTTQCIYKHFVFIFVKVISSDTDGSESENDCGGSENGCSDEEDHEEWYEDVDDLLQDVAHDEPLPEPTQYRSATKTMTTLLQWFVYFLLFWQATCKLSDNGLEWLLRFIFQFLHVVGITCNNEYLCQMALMFPSSLYLL